VGAKRVRTVCALSGKATRAGEFAEKAAHRQGKQIRMLRFTSINGLARSFRAESTRVGPGLSDAGDVFSEEVDAVSVEVAAGAVVMIGGAWVGVPGEDLGVTQGDSGVQGVGDRGVPH